MKRTSTVNDLAPTPHCIWHALALLIGLGVCMPSLVQAEEGLGIEDTYDPEHDESYSYGAPWYSRGQEESDRTYGRRDGGIDYDSGPSSTERRKAAERREKEQQEVFRRQDREHVAAHEAMCQQQLPALTDAVRIHRESYETLQSQVRCNADAAMAAYTAETFADTYDAVSQIAEQVQAAEVALEAQLDASAMLAPPLGPEQADALGIAVQGSPFETQAPMEGWDALIVTSVQHQEVSAKVATLLTHAQERMALLDGAALFIAGADHSFSRADASTGYALLSVAQEGLDMALTLAAFTPSGATFNVARTLAEYVLGYDFVTGAPIEFGTVDTVGMAMVLFPGGKPFAKLAKIFGKVAKAETRLGTNARRLWGRLVKYKNSTEPTDAISGLEKASKLADVDVGNRVARQSETSAALSKYARVDELPANVREKFYSSLRTPYKGEETRAGIKLKSHGAREPTVYRKISGPPEKINKAAESEARDIAEHPDTRYRVRRTETTDNPYIEIQHPDGRMVRCRLDGEFVTFLEPR